MRNKEDRPSEQESDTCPPSKTSECDSEASAVTVEYQELLDENDQLKEDLKKANKEITRLRNNL